MSTSLIYHGFGIVGYNYLKNRLQRRENLFSHLKETRISILYWLQIERSNQERSKWALINHKNNHNILFSLLFRNAQRIISFPIWNKTNNF